jgi:two-component system alkaline phosphatase synthesis response regulator PhoP
MATRILIVEDEEHIARPLRINLEAEGYKADIVTDGTRAIEAIRSGGHDLILLDIMLPGASGFEVAETVRGEGIHTPILFVTARDREDDRLRGLEIGGDDYITKPFSVRELIGRIQAMLRRQQWYSGTENQANLSSDEVAFGGNRVNFRAYRAETKSGKVELTEKECMLLKALVDREGEVVRREEILDTVWGYDRYPSSRTIDNIVLNLRKYFEEDPKAPKHILTQYGAGYRFVRE